MGYDPDDEFFKRVGGDVAESSPSGEEEIARILREAGQNVVWCATCDCYVERVNREDHPERDCHAPECPIEWAGYVLDEDEIDERFDRLSVPSNDLFEPEDDPD
jgi:hypothetical protein